MSTLKDYVQDYTKSRIYLFSVCIAFNNFMCKLETHSKKSKVYQFSFRLQPVQTCKTRLINIKKMKKLFIVLEVTFCFLFDIEGALPRIFYLNIESLG